MRKIYFLDKNGNQLISKKKKWFRGFLKKLFYTRKITFKAPWDWMMLRYKCYPIDYDYMVNNLVDAVSIDEMKLLVQEIMEYEKNLRASLKESS